jgi:ankyrin repeat protein
MTIAHLALLLISGLQCSYGWYHGCRLNGEIFGADFQVVKDGTDCGLIGNGCMAQIVYEPLALVAVRRFCNAQETSRTYSGELTDDNAISSLITAKLRQTETLEQIEQNWLQFQGKNGRNCQILANLHGYLGNRVFYYRMISADCVRHVVFPLLNLPPEFIKVFRPSVLKVLARFVKSGRMEGPSAQRLQHSLARELVHHGIRLPKKMGCSLGRLAFDGCRSGDEKLVKYAISHGFDIDSTNKRGHSCISTAIKENQAGCFWLLVESGANLAQVVPNGEEKWNMLEWACKSKNYDAMAYLFNLKQFALSRFIPHIVESVMQVLLVQPRTKVEEFLRKSSFEMDSYGGVSYLIAAISANEVEFAMLFLEIYSGSVNIADRNGLSPLQAAMFHGHCRLVECLLDCGAQMPSHTAIILAIWNHQSDALQIVFDRFDQISTERLTEYLMLAIKKSDAKIVRNLLERRPNLDAYDTDGDNAVTLAASRGHFDSVQFLLSAGADPNSANRKTGMSALCLAVKGLHVQAAAALLMHPLINLHQKDNDGRTALQHLVLWIDDANGRKFDSSSTVIAKIMELRALLVSKNPQIPRLNARLTATHKRAQLTAMGKSYTHR